jgi:hypothetical protein
LGAGGLRFESGRPDHLLEVFSFPMARSWGASSPTAFPQAGAAI